MKLFLLNHKKNIENFLFILLPISMVAGNAAINFLTFILLILLLFSVNKNFFLKDDYIFWFIIFYLYLILNAFLAEDILLSLYRAIFFFRFFILYFFLKYFFILKKKNTANHFLFWFFIVIIISLDLIYQSYTGENITGYKTEYPMRSSSFFYDELIVGHFLFSFGYISLLFLYLKNKKYLFLIFSIFITIACFLSGERANSIRCLIMLIGIFLLIFKDLDKKKFLFSLLIIILSFFLILNSNKNFKSRLNENFSRIDVEESFHKKYIKSTWGAHAITSYLIFKDRPIFGIGSKNFRVKCRLYENVAVKKYFSIPGGCSTHPHQIYYEILSEHGIFGFCIIFIILFNIIRKRLNNKLCFINKIALVNLFIYFLPLIPTGSFFSTVVLFTFWLNLSFFLINFNSK